MFEYSTTIKLFETINSPEKITEDSVPETIPKNKQLKSESPKDTQLKSESPTNNRTKSASPSDKHYSVPSMSVDVEMKEQGHGEKLKVCGDSVASTARDKRKGENDKGKEEAKLNLDALDDLVVVG